MHSCSPAVARNISAKEAKHVFGRCFAIFLATLRFLFFLFLQPATPDICFTTYRPSRDHHYHRRCHSVVPSTSLSWSRRNTRTVCVGGDEWTDGGSIIVWRDIRLSRSLPNSLSVSLSCSFSSQIRSRAHFNLTLQFTLVAIVSTMPTTRPFRGRRNGVEKCLPCFASISLAYRRKCWTRVWHGNGFVVCGCCCWCCCWKKHKTRHLPRIGNGFVWMVSVVGGSIFRVPSDMTLGQS